MFSQGFENSALCDSPNVRTAILARLELQVTCSLAITSFVPAQVAIDRHILFFRLLTLVRLFVNQGAELGVFERSLQLRIVKECVCQLRLVRQFRLPTVSTYMGRPNESRSSKAGLTSVVREVA